MEKLFGIPTTSIALVLMIMLALCLLVTVWVAIRRPVVFKLGVRNIPRRKAQTILIVIGLMLSTLIISAAMTFGDTLNHSINSQAYQFMGHTDQIVVQSSETTDANINNAISNKIPESSLALVQNALAGDENVKAIAPITFELVPIMNDTTNLGEPGANVSGMNPADIEAFGGLRNLDGGKIDFASLTPGQVVINKTAQKKLDAKVGDTLTFYYNNQAYQVTVAGIAKDEIIAGSVDFNNVGMMMPLDNMRSMLGLNNDYSAILISNNGPVRGAEDLSDGVEATLAPALEGHNLGINKTKQELVKQSELFANIFTSLFLVMGLFSMAAGIMLIVLIFSMLAAERRSEMGMTRAIGAQRRQLIQQFISEGTGYALIAGLVGSALGVAVAFGMAKVMASLFGDEINISAYVTPKSLIIAYCLGVVITFFAVVIGSWRISRLNIVSAIRDIPDVSHHRRRLRILIFGVILIAIGALMSLGAGTSMFLFGTGMCLWPFGVLLITRYFGIPSRIPATLVGLWIVVFWLMPDATFTRIFGKYSGDFELFFVSGIFLVIGSTIVIMQNTDILLAIISWFGGLFKTKLPAVRTAVAYPGAARGRTGMTIAMFSLIIFSLVMMATISENFSRAFLNDDAAAGWDVRAQAGQSNPIDNFEQTLQAQGIDTSGITNIGEIDSPVSGNTQVRMPGATEWKYYSINGMDTGYLDHADLYFQQRAAGYDSDQAVIDALKSGQPFAVIDANAAGSGGGFDGGAFAADVHSTNDVFQPFEIEVLNPTTGDVSKLTVIGVIDSKISSLTGIYTNRATTDSIFHSERGFTSYYLALQNPGDSKAMADQIESKLLMNGVQADSIQQELKDSQKQSMSFLYLIEGFMALGLVVGVAAIGVIAFRSVVERRQQIGVLRALGFQRSLVSLSFMIETAFVVGMGVLAGGTMGIILARNLFNSDDFTSGTKYPFTVPWPLLILMLVATIVAALAMTWIPARQASHIAPAEALRYE